MVKLIFKDGENYIDPNSGLQPPIYERLKIVIDDAFLSITCPNHEPNSYATLLLNVDYGNFGWEIIDFCCPEFSQAIKTEMPYPWNHAQRHQKP